MPLLRHDGGRKSDGLPDLPIRIPQKIPLDYLDGYFFGNCFSTELYSLSFIYGKERPVTQTDKANKLVIFIFLPIKLGFV